MNCPYCKVACNRFGKNRNGTQRFRCPSCKKTCSSAEVHILPSRVVQLTNCQTAEQPDLLREIRQALPYGQNPEFIDDLISDIAVFVYEGKIERENLAYGIRSHLTELRRTYRFGDEISIETPIKDNLTLKDLLLRPALPPKSRRRIGRPVTIPRGKRKCIGCNCTFYFAAHEGEEPKFCSKECRDANRHLIHAGKPRKLPAAQKVIELYQSGLSSTQIAAMYGCNTHKTVTCMLERAGVQRRAAVRITHNTCQEAGCNAPVYLIRHPGNGSWYGTRCKEHRTIHYNRLNRDERRKTKGTPPDKYRPSQINELKPKGWKWITKSKKLLREVRKLTNPSA